MEDLLRRKYQVRRASVYGKEVTLPPDAKVEPGDEVLQIYDGFVLIVPKGAKVDETLLQKAIVMKPGNA